MNGSFVAAKVKAFQASQDGNKIRYGGGGWIEDGKPHSRGGKKFFAGDGEVRELESGEYVVRKDQAEKHGHLLEAINEVSDESLRAMLRQLGIHLSEDLPRQSIQ